MSPFPVLNLAFDGTTYAILIGLLAIAAVIDLRWAIVPKWVSLTTLALGVTCNVIRGAWLGGLGKPTWSLSGDGPLIGAADGFLFSLAGFAVGFAIFFFLWIVQACKGGDVKLFAAVSAWVGPFICLWILVLSTVILIALVGLRMVVLAFSQSPKALLSARTDKAGKLPSAQRGPTFSLSIALATALAMLWFVFLRPPA